MFEPPFCPNPECGEHRSPRGRFFVRKGSYRPRCRAHRIPRFRCKSCGRWFSRQTFRVDYRDHRPGLNAAVLVSVATGIGLRQTARDVGLSRRCTELKVRKLTRYLRGRGLELATRGRRRSVGRSTQPSRPGSGPRR